MHFHDKPETRLFVNHQVETCRECINIHPPTNQNWQLEVGMSIRERISCDRWRYKLIGKSKKRVHETILKRYWKSWWKTSELVLTSWMKHVWLGNWTNYDILYIYNHMNLFEIFEISLNWDRRVRYCDHQDNYWRYRPGILTRRWRDNPAVIEISLEDIL